ncbi:MAG: DUF349 domain-containing protein [Atopobiaceae bacterium]|nr:DUF349 domain-containing protein [Atopobiaceae bacterium]
MEPEENVVQDITASESVEDITTDAVEDAVAEEVAPEASAEEAVAEVAAPEAEPEASEEAAPAEDAAAEDATTEAAEEAPAEEAAPTEAAEEGVVVATDDVAPAQSKIEIARIAKEALIERAKELEDSVDWRKATDAQRALMEEWRAAGYAGKELNDKLWDEFRAARDKFFTRRDEHYTELRAEQAKVVEAKKQIIEEAKQLTSEVQNWVRTSDALNALMDRWKAAGNAGRDNEHVLWEEFNGIRRDFRNRRKADLADRRAKERACADAKRKIVEEAKAIAEAKEYTRENSDRMRVLNDEYKAAGYAGKPANDTLWQEFRTAQNAYWEGNSAHRDQQRRERTERLNEAVERKSGQIEHLKDQNETLTTRLESTLNPEKVAQIKRWIAENEQRLGGLQDDIDEIKAKI